MGRRGNSSLACEMLGLYLFISLNCIKSEQFAPESSVSFPSRFEYIPVQMQARVHATVLGFF